MSRTSRSKSQPTEQVKNEPQHRKSRWLIGVAVVSVMLACVAVVWIARSTSTVPVVVDTPAKQISIPDPDTASMQPPVAQAVRKARNEVVNRPDSAPDWAQYGAVLDAHKILSDAIICYGRAHQLDPQDARWVYLLAIALTLEGVVPDQAVTHFREALRLAPENIAAYIRLGLLLVEQGKLEEARALYGQALDRSPDLAVAHFELGQVLLRLEKTSEAIERLERAAELAPQDGASRAALAMAYRRMGDRDRATAMAESARSLTRALPIPDPLYRSVQNLSKNSLSARQRLEHYLQKGEYGKAIPELLTYLQTKGDHPYYQMLTAVAYLRNDQPQRAGPHFARALQLKNTILASASDDTRRMEQVTKADSVMAAFLPQYIELAIDTGSGNVLSELTEILERHAGMIPAKAEIEMAWGNLYRKLGNTSAAKQHYTRAVELDPTSPAAQRLLSLE